MTTNRETLIHAALTALDNSETFTVDTLASTLHMSKSTLYKYFGGLDELVYASIDHLCNQTDADLSEASSSDFQSVAKVFAAHACRAPSALLSHRAKVQTAARLRLDNVETRMGERMFRAAIAKGATPLVANGIRSAYIGSLRFVATVPKDQREAQFGALTETALKGLA